MYGEAHYILRNYVLLTIVSCSFIITDVALQTALHIRMHKLVPTQLCLHARQAPNKTVF